MLRVHWIQRDRSRHLTRDFPTRGFMQHMHWFAELAMKESAYLDVDQISRFRVRSQLKIPFPKISTMHP